MAAFLLSKAQAVFHSRPIGHAYLGGVRSGGKRGRGAAGKTPFVAAVSTSPEGRPRKLKLAPVNYISPLNQATLSFFYEYSIQMPILRFHQIRMRE